MINRKVIIPVYDVFCNIFHKFRYSYSVSQKLSDIEKVFDYLSARYPAAHRSRISYGRRRTGRNQKNIEFGISPVISIKRRATLFSRMRNC